MSTIETMLNSVKWEPVEAVQDDECDLPYVTHTGTLMLGEKSLTVHQLSDGRRVFDAEELSGLFEQ